MNCQKIICITVRNCNLCANATACDTCITGYYGVNCTKNGCNSNCVLCQNATTCSTCITGYSGANCTKISCFPNCLLCTSASLCNTCATGYSGTDCSTVQCNIVSCASCLLPNVCNRCAVSAFGAIENNTTNFTEDYNRTKISISKVSEATSAS